MTTLLQTRAEFGRFRPIAEIGRGGMAEVHLAHTQGPVGFHKLVVLKLVREHLAEDPDAKTMLMDEARLAGRLNHPNVVQTLEVTEIGASPVIVMEYLEGQSFSAILRRAQAEGKPLDLAACLHIVCEALQGIHYAHQLKDFDGSALNLVHRDVSPHNIFVTYDGRVKVLDFGIAKAAITQSETRAGVLKGKVAYMAPEQALGMKVDHRADIYAMGAVLWQIVTGRALWKELPEGHALYKLVQGNVPRPSTINPDVDPRLESCCMKALSTAPEDRYPNALALAEDLESILDSLGRPSTRSLGVVVEGLFDDVRKETQALIEKQLKQHAHGSEDQSSPKLMASGGWHRTAFRSESAVETGDESASRARVSSAAPIIVSSGVLPPKRNRWIVAAASAGALVVAFGLWTALKPQQPPVAQTAPSAVPSSQVMVAIAASPSAEPVQTSVEITVSPDSARVFVDDVEVKERPARVSFERADSLHRIRAEAEGYKTQQLEVQADSPKSIQLQLAEMPRTVVASSDVKTRPARTTKSDTARETAADIVVPPPPAAVPPAPPPDRQPADSARDRIKNLDRTTPW